MASQESQEQQEALARAGIDLGLSADHVPGLRTIRKPLVGVTDMLSFWFRVLIEMRGVWRYSAEILSQTARIISGTVVILFVLEFTIGGTLGLTAVYILRSIGATDFSGVFTALAGVRESLPFMFGYVFAAKVGCGFVAEIGSMRISDELDAFESVGLDPVRFVVCTRLAAAWLFTPVAFGVASVAVYLGADFTVVHALGATSQGQFALFHFGLQSAFDQLISFVKLFTIATAIVLVSAYYGFNARGGPAEVGSATARSMVVNLVLLQAIDAFVALVFYGTNPHVPIGGGGGI